MPAAGWRDRAACRDGAVDMFPDLQDAAAVTRAAAVCRRCPTRRPCGALARRLEAGWGVWGGRPRALNPADLVDPFLEPGPPTSCPA